MQHLPLGSRSRRRPLLVAVAALLATLVSSPLASADEAPKDEAPKAEAPKAEAPKDEAPKDEAPKKKHRVESPTFHDATPNAAVMPPKRPVPDYGGADLERSGAENAALWVPRLVLAPVYLTTEYLVRRPLGGLVTGIERDRVVQRAVYLFTFGGNEKIGIIPTAFIDFGLLPSVGLYFFLDDAFVDHNHLRVHFGTWGAEWLKLTVTDRYDVGEHATAAIRASFTRRSDNPYFGMGPDSKQDNESRYGATILDAGPVYEMQLAPRLQLRTTAGARRTTFHEGTCCEDPSVQTRVANGEVAPPPRFSGGYTIGYQSAELTVDTRDPRPAPQSGIRVYAEAQPAFDVSRKDAPSWVRYGGTVAGFWDVTGKARVLSLAFFTRFVDPIRGAGDAIPFTEQVSLGGADPMPGFIQGRLVDRSAAVATLSYAWPIWVFLDGVLHVSTGNVFGAGLRDFDARKLRLSSGIGVRSNGSPDQQFEIIAGLGTDTFENGAHVTSFRLAFGATHGF